MGVAVQNGPPQLRGAALPQGQIQVKLAMGAHLQAILTLVPGKKNRNWQSLHRRMNPFAASPNTVQLPQFLSETTLEQNGI